MKISRLHINSFGCLENVSLEFDNGFQLIEGANESGKSTLQAFIRAMLFGMEKGRSRSSRENGYGRYMPWNRNPAYGGSLEITESGECYSIYRNFDANHSTCRIFNETKHLEISNPEAFLKELLQGLTPQLFDNTLSISQLTAEAGKPLADELRNHIVNLRTSGSAGIDVNAALTRLKLQKRGLQSAFSRSAQNDADELDRQIASYQRLAASSSISSELKELEEKKDETERMIQHYAAQHQAMADKAQADQEYVQRFQIGTEEQIDSLLAEADRIYDTVTRHRFADNDASASASSDTHGETRTDRRNRSTAETRRESGAETLKARSTARPYAEGQEDKGDRRSKARSSGLTSTQIGIAVFFFVIAAILLILGVNSMSREGQNHFVTVLLVAGGLASIAACIMQFTRNKKSNFNIDLDELYANGITEELLSAAEDDGKAGMPDYGPSYNHGVAPDRSRAEMYTASKSRTASGNSANASGSSAEASRSFAEASRSFAEASGELQRLDELYRRFCPDGTETNNVSRLNAIADVLEECRRRLHSSKSSSSRMKADMDSLLESQKIASEINEQLEKARKTAWQAEQHYEELRQLQDRRDALDESLSRNQAVSVDVAAVDLAIKTLQELSSTSFGSLGYYLDQRTSQIAEELTEGSCTELTVGGDLNVTIRQSGRLIPLYQASRGTIEQIWFALRLASIEFIWPDGDMPLFLDETMIAYDEDRMTATLRWLIDNYPGQIFLSTCHRREGKVLSALSAPFSRIQF